MRLSFFIAKRYLISKKSHNLINIISLISVIGLSVGTMALIVVLSVFNGFEDVIKSLYTTFNADLQISAVNGKTIHYNNFPNEEIMSVQGISGISQVVEEDALFKYRDKQHIARIKGVSDNFIELSRIDTMTVNGSFILQEGNSDFAVVGAGIAWYLDIYPQNITNLLSIFVPRRGNASSFNFENAFNNRAVHPTGVFSIQQEFDEKYVFVPLRFARELLEYTDEVTSIEVRYKRGDDDDKIQSRVQSIVGKDYHVKNRFQQNESLFKILRSEKTAIFLILVFILILSSFNMIGSLSILIVEKNKDIGILASMGADLKLIKTIFITEGMLISLIGSVAGLAIGFVILFIQESYGLLQLGGGDGAFVISAYPVSMQFMDFVYVFITVQAIGFFATLYPVVYLTKRIYNK
ncbi:MAG: ABC transporter permease [Bacteroidetes bacterium]|nr:ABC transporter permease [Bacteroidota bacterium]MBL6943359.1 ABC transporter permease [Bacteroidales bacterium]